MKRERIIERKAAAYAQYLNLEELGVLGFSVTVRRLRRPMLRRRSEKATSM